MKRVTIKDLAKMLHLSTSTVSRALSDHPDISDATKSRVRQVAEQFNYTTNIHARFFRKQHSGIIALILPEINMFFTPDLINGIDNVIADSSYSLSIFLTNDSYNREKEVIKQCLGWAVEGVLISLSRETRDLDHLSLLTSANIKCVILDRTVGDGDFPRVTINSQKASAKAVTHLIQNGHSDILGVFGNPNLSMTKERTEGYKMAFAQNNIPVLSENIVSVENSGDLDFILPPIFKHNKKITAVFSMTDELLIKILYHISRLGLTIPQDLSVITISDGVYPYLVHPRISHIKNTGGDIGQTACQLLIDLIMNVPLVNTEEGQISTPLVELDSIKILS